MIPTYREQTLCQTGNPVEVFEIVIIRARLKNSAPGFIGQEMPHGQKPPTRSL